jgi:cytokinin dehydrogenase
MGSNGDSLPAALFDLTLDGEITTDDTARAEVAEDFGHIKRQLPRAVLRPRSTQDVAIVVRVASEHGIPVAARGMGHSTFGQAQAADGIVIDMRSLSAIEPVDHDTITVEAGATWRAVVTATSQYGRTPPVLTDYLGLSVGGTLSVGGIGGRSHRYGAQTDHVTQLEVVTGDGTIYTCTPETQSELFYSVLAGLGHHGIITRATLALVPEPTGVRRYKLYYPTAAALTADQRMLLHEGRFAYLQGDILPTEQGWVYILDAAFFRYPSAESYDDHLLAGLSDTRPLADIQDLTYLDFADHIAAVETLLRSTGEWSRPHPWWTAFLPDTVTDAFLDQLVSGLTVEDIGATGLIFVYPGFTAPMTTPLLRRPDTPVMFRVGILRTSPPDETAVGAAIADNRRWYDLARSLGGIGYHIGTIPLSPADWIEHFGPVWPSFSAAARRHDPHHVLCPGQGIDFCEDAQLVGSGQGPGKTEGTRRSENP